MVSGKSERNKAARPRQMTLAAVRGFMEAIAASNPEPETELDYSTPYSLLVAVVMSAQATDVSVNRVSRTLFAEAPNPEAMVRLGVDGVAKAHPVDWFMASQGAKCRGAVAAID